MSEQERAMLGLMPASWDRGPIGLALEIKGFLASIKDAGTHIDSGGGDGLAHLWVKVDGAEYFIEIRKSNAQLEREGKPTGQAS